MSLCPLQTSDTESVGARRLDYGDLPTDLVKNFPMLLL